MTKQYRIISNNVQEQLTYQLEQFARSHNIISLNYSTAMDSNSWSGSVMHSVLIEYTTQ